MSTLVFEDQISTIEPGRKTHAVPAAFCPQCFSDQVAELYDGGVYCLECNQRSGSVGVRS